MTPMFCPLPWISHLTIKGYATEAAAWLAEQKAALMPLWLSWGQDLAHVRDVHLHTGIDHDEDADKADRLI